MTDSESGIDSSLIPLYIYICICICMCTHVSTEHIIHMYELICILIMHIYCKFYRQINLSSITHTLRICAYKNNAYTKWTYIVDRNKCTFHVIEYVNVGICVYKLVISNRGHFYVWKSPIPVQALGGYPELLLNFFGHAIEKIKIGFAMQPECSTRQLAYFRFHISRYLR